MRLNGSLPSCWYTEWVLRFERGEYFSLCRGVGHHSRALALAPSATPFQQTNFMPQSPSAHLNWCGAFSTPASPVLILWLERACCWNPREASFQWFCPTVHFFVICRLGDRHCGTLLWLNHLKVPMLCKPCVVYSSLPFSAKAHSRHSLFPVARHDREQSNNSTGI